MNLKNLYISAGVLAILAIITSYLNSSNNAPLLDERVGSTVVDKALLRNAGFALPFVEIPRPGVRREFVLRSAGFFAFLVSFLALIPVPVQEFVVVFRGSHNSMLAML